MIAANEAVASLLAARGTPCLYRVHERPEPARIVRLVDQLASLEVPTPPLPEPMSPSQAAELVGRDLPGGGAPHAQHRAAGGSRSARSCCARSSRPTTRPSTSVTPGCGRAPTATSPRRSAATRTSSATGRCSRPSARTSTRRGPRSWGSSASGPPNASARRPRSSATPTTSPAASCSSACCAAEGPERAFAGEVVGLISAGAFVAFSAAQPAGGRAAVRGDAAGAGAGRGRRPAPGAGRERPRDGRGRRDGRPARGGRARRRARGSSAAAADWWELNEEGTILRGERSGSSIRLGQPLSVRVERVEAIRGRSSRRSRRPAG